MRSKKCYAQGAIKEGESEKKMRGKKTFTDESEVFAAELKNQIKSRSKHEGVRILLKKVKYWYWSAIDWRDCCLHEKAIIELETLQKEAKLHVQSVPPGAVKAFHSGMETAFEESIAILKGGLKR